MSRTAVRAGLRIRDLDPADLDRVVDIDASHTGERKPEYWRGVLGGFVGRPGDPRRAGLAAEQGGRLVGYLLGEIRAFEFGSEPCGWIFAVGVDPESLRGGVAGSLLEEVCRRFRDAGLERVRTMVRRDDIPVLSFFRAGGFVGGSFVQLERRLADVRS